MIAKSLSAGITGLRRRAGLVGLVYGLDLALAFVLALPVYFALDAAVGTTGFGADLARQFDVVLWADIMEEIGPALGALALQLLWLVPLYLVWKTAAGVGLVHALQGEQIRPFWQGVGRYTGRGLLLALCFLVPLAVVLIGVVIVALVLNTIWTGEVGSFWVNFVALPMLLISGFAVLDLMHDYARIALVVDDQKVLTAIGTGLAWPIKHGQARWMYLIWFVPAAVLLLLPTVLDTNVVAATGISIWLLFIGQQLLLLLRAGITVGWIGSEVALYETVRLREMPLIATGETEPESYTAPWPAEEQPGATSA